MLCTIASLYGKVRATSVEVSHNFSVFIRIANDIFYVSTEDGSSASANNHFFFHNTSSMGKISTKTLRNDSTNDLLLILLVLQQAGSCMVRSIFYA